MSFNPVLYFILGLIVFIIGSLWLTVLASTVMSMWITKWFAAREEYVKRMSMLPDHNEYEKVH